MDITKKIYDKKFRSDLMNNPKKHIQEWGDSLSNELDIVVKKNTKNTTYVVIPYQGSGDDFLGQIQAAGVGCAGTAGTLFCASTYGTVCGTLSTAGSAGSIATTGCAK